MDYSGLNHGELSLILATELVKKEIDHDYDFDDGASQAALQIAEKFYKYLVEHN